MKHPITSIRHKMKNLGEKLGHTIVYYAEKEKVPCLASNLDTFFKKICIRTFLKYEYKNNVKSYGLPIEDRCCMVMCDFNNHDYKFSFITYYKKTDIRFHVRVYHGYVNVEIKWCGILYAHKN